MALQRTLFPIDQPVPEEQQVGRRSSIEALERRLRRVSHQWLIGERRIGKTSAAKAVLARLQQRGAVTLDVDLTKLGMITHDNLAAEIAAQAAAAGVSTLTDHSRTGLDKVLTELAGHARATGQNSFVLLDEVQLLERIPDADRHIARWCREPESPIMFILAGSEEAAIRGLREVGRPLAAVGSDFTLPEISPEDWRPALRSRFAEGDVRIGERELEAIVEASGGHPRRTMLAASNVYASASAQPDQTASATLVELAIDDAKRDLSWR